MSLFEPDRNSKIFDSTIADLRDFINKSIELDTLNPILEDGTELKDYALEVTADDPEGPLVLLEYGGPTTTLTWSNPVNEIDDETIITLTRTINDDEINTHLFHAFIKPRDVEQLTTLFFGDKMFG